MNLLLKNMDIITGDRETGIIRNGCIAIKNGIFEYVGTMDGSPQDFQADRVIQGTRRLVMPGLVNSHTHSAMTLLRNYADDLALEDWLFNHIFPVEARMTEEDIYYGTLLAIAEMIRSGTTTFADMYMYMDMVAKAVEQTGVRANISRSPYSLSNGKATDKTPDCIDFFKRWNGKADGRIKVYVELHSVYLFEEAVLRSTAALAAQLGTGIHIHILETAKEKEDILKKYGRTSVELCEDIGIFDVPVLAAHCVHLTDNDIGVLHRNKVNAAHNPTSNLKLGSGIARIPLMLEKGVNVCLGTDGTASNNNLNMFEEMHLAALIHKGVNMDPKLVCAQQAIEMASVNGARALGFGEVTGCIRKGMRADLIILDTDKPHLCPMNNPVSAAVYSAQASDVHTVIVDGRILMENRELKTIDEELVKGKVEEISRRLAEQI